MPSIGSPKPLLQEINNLYFRAVAYLFFLHQGGLKREEYMLYSLPSKWKLPDCRLNAKKA
ncbi:hypothetical protein [Nostoc sp.]|uniref:hypothetical protein n=1 Tax=Nostoc sp. TaxID=1180 RepID=UPI002FFD0EE0